MLGVRATLTGDATMGWIRKLNIYGANGTVNLLLAYVRVRDAQGVGVTGLRAKDFKIVRLNPWAEHPAGESLPIRYLSEKLGIPDSPAGSYVFNLGTQGDESGPRECALMITRDEERRRHLRKKTCLGCLASRKLDTNKQRCF
jgi:hypothetical protein